MDHDPLLGDPYWLVEGHTIEVDVPIEAAMEYGGTTRHGNHFHMSPPTVELPAYDLVWGRFRLGRFVMDGLSGSLNRGDIAPHYVATLRRTEQPGGPARREPIDDTFALWLKRARDEYTRDTVSWRVVNALLDEYRDHRATGEPLNQPASGPHTTED